MRALIGVVALAVTHGRHYVSSNQTNHTLPRDQPNHTTLPRVAVQTNHTLPRVAVCLSGDIRTLPQPKMLHDLKTGVLEPLRADLFMFVGASLFSSKDPPCPPEYVNESKYKRGGDPPKWSTAQQRAAVAGFLGDDDFEATLSRLVRALDPKRLRVIGCGADLRARVPWCVSDAEETRLVEEGKGLCAKNEAEMTQRDHYSGYAQWLKMKACFGLVEAEERAAGVEYDFVVRYRPDAMWNGGLNHTLDGATTLELLGRWRGERVMLGNHDGRCADHDTPTCDLINDVFATLSRPVARAYFVDSVDLMRDHVCKQHRGGGGERVIRSAAPWCVEHPDYPECVFATAVYIAHGTVPHVCSLLDKAKHPYDDRGGCPFRGAGGVRAPWYLGRWTCEEAYAGLEKSARNTSKSRHAGTIA